MSWIYALLVWICALVSILTDGEVGTLFLGMEIGILIGQIVHLIIVVKEMKSNDIFNM